VLRIAVDTEGWEQRLMKDDVDNGVRAHLRRVVIGEILRTLPPDEARRVVSVAVQRLAQYADEGPVQSISASNFELRAAIDQLIEELRFILGTLR
jgi:hypothetical protein